MSVRSIIIARSSKDRHDVSCQSQVAEIRQAAKARGEIVVRTLTFAAVRHSEFLEEPDFLELLDEAKRKDRSWSKLWLYDTARLSRNRLKAQTTKAFLRRHGITIEFLKVPSTGEEAMDNVIEGILECFDQLHADFSRAGSIRGQRQNVRRGFRAGGAAPFGYRLKPVVLGRNGQNEEVCKTQLEPDPETFPVVREYLSRRAAGESRGRVLRDFELRGIPSPSGNPRWAATTGHAIERNLLVYEGHLVFGRHNRKMDGGYVGGQKYRPRDEWEVHENAHPAAITQDEARRIEAQAAARSRGNRPTPQARRYLLTGVLTCGSCGGPMVGDRQLYSCSWRKRRVKDCQNGGISAARIDEYVIGQVRDVLLSPEHFHAVVQATREEYQKLLSGSGEDTARKRARVDEIDRQLDRLVELYASGKIDAQAIERRVGSLSEEKARLEAEVLDHEQIGAALECSAEIVTDDAVRGHLARFESLREGEHHDELRAFVSEFVERVELSPAKGSRRKPRKVLIYGKSPEFTRTALASPTVASSNFFTRLGVLREGLAEAA